MRREKIIAIGLTIALSACGGRSSQLPATVSTSGVASSASIATARALAPLAVSPLARGLRSLGFKVYESDNWAGYALVGKEFSDVRGSWIVPTITCAANPNGAASFWVGIDGWDNDTVEQTGTESQCNGIKPIAYAWYELFPKAGVTVTSVPVSPGDAMTANVHFNGSAFVVSIADSTTGKSFTTSATVPGAKRASAEWITESNGSTGLPDFDIVRYGEGFTGATGTNAATDAGASGPIAAFGNRVRVSIMVDGKTFEAVPSMLTADGSSFDVTYLSP
jgi:hypothetical protein